MIKSFDYGYFRIEKHKSNDPKVDDIAFSLLIDEVGIVKRIFEGDIIVKQITDDVFFLIAPINNKTLFIKNTSKGMFIQEFNYSNNKEPFYKTDYLIDHGLMIVNHGSCDYLFSIKEGKIISDGYDAITERDGVIFISIELESGNYSGILNLNGDLVNNSISFNEFDVAFEVNPHDRTSSFQKIDWYATQLLNKKREKLNAEYQTYKRIRRND